MKITQLLRLNSLFDFYRGILTDFQQQIMHEYLELNFTLTEIAEKSGITKQAVSDVLRRSIKKLADFEEKLGLVDKYEKIKASIPALAKDLAKDTYEQQKIEQKFTKLINTLED